MPRSVPVGASQGSPVFRSPADPKDLSTVMAAGGWRIAIGLFLLAVLVRGIFLLEISASPLFRIPLVDAETYNTLARQLAEHRQWSKDFFWQPPFYPFFLSLTYALSGGSMAAAKIVQALIGGVTCGLTFVLGALLMGRRVGILAGIIVAFYMPLVFFESDLIAAGMAAFWSVLLMLLLLEHGRAGGRWGSLAIGFTAALAILTRPTFLLFLVCAFVWLCLISYRRAGIRAAASAGLLALCGFAVAAIPAAVINGSRVSGSYTILPSSGGINVYIGNNPDVCHTLTARPGWGWSELTALPYREGVERRADQEAFYYGKVRAFLKSDPMGFLRNIGLKTARFISSREIPRNVDPYACRPWSHLLSALFWKIGGFGFPFGVLLPLAVAGAWRNRARVPVILWLFLLAFPLAVIAVFVADRYRVPMIPILSILASGGVWAILKMLRDREGRAIAVTSAVIAATVLVSCLPGPFCEERGDSAAELDFMLGLASFHQSQAETDPRAAAADMEAAGRYYRRAIASNPVFADAYSELGNLAFAREEYREAGDFYAKALEIRPDHGKALHSLGVLLFLAGSNDTAIDCLRRAQQLDPSFSKTSFFLGQALLKGGDAGGAIPVLRKAIRTEGDPVYRALGMNFLAEALIASGAPQEGIDQYRQAIEVDSRCVPALAGLAWILATDADPASSDRATAAGIAERALTLEEPSARTLDALAASYAAIGRFPEAVEAAKGALEDARAQEDTLLASRIEARIRLYAAGRPYREGPAH